MNVRKHLFFIMLTAMVLVVMCTAFVIIIGGRTDKPHVQPLNSSAITERLVVTERDAWVLNRATWKHNDHFVELCWMSVDHFKQGTVAIEMIDCEKYRQIQAIEAAIKGEEKKP